MRISFTKKMICKDISGFENRITLDKEYIVTIEEKEDGSTIKRFRDDNNIFSQTTLDLFI